MVKVKYPENYPFPLSFYSSKYFPLPWKLIGGTKIFSITNFSSYSILNKQLFLKLSRLMVQNIQRKLLQNKYSSVSWLYFPTDKIVYELFRKKFGETVYDSQLEQVKY